MGAGEAVKKGFGVARRSGGLLLVLFVFGAIWNLLSIFFSDQVQTATPQASATVIAAGIAFIFITIFMQAGSLGYIRDKIKQGSASLSSFVSYGGKYYVRLLVIALIVALALGAFVLLAALSAALLGNRLPPLAVTLAVFFALVGVYFLILLFLAPYAAVADEKKSLESVRHSMTLLSKSVHPVIGIVFMVGFLVVSLGYLIAPPFRQSKSGRSALVRVLVIATALIAVGFVSGLLLGIVFAAISALLQGIAAQVVFGLLSSLVNSFLGLWVTASFMSFYLSLSNNNTQGAE